MVKVRETYAGAGERGFIGESRDYTFRGLVYLLEGTEPSCYPLPEDLTCFWPWFTRHYSAGVPTRTTEFRGYHAVDTRAARYMVKAWRYTEARRKALIAG